MSATGQTRTAPRHALELNLRFDRDGSVRRGVTENVSATGMYVRAAHVPSAGEIITLTTVPIGRAIRAEIVGEVRWGRGAPSLDFPEPGFGIRFSEIYATQADRDGLITLLDELGVAHAASSVRIETRGDASLVVCHL